MPRYLKRRLSISTFCLLSSTYRCVGVSAPHKSVKANVMYIHIGGASDDAAEPEANPYKMSRYFIVKEDKLSIGSSKFYY